MVEVIFVSTIGENIKAARINKGLTQQDLATALNTTKSAVSRYELGKREPRYKLLQEMAVILDVSCSELIGDADVELEMRKSELRAKISEALKESASANDLLQNLEDELLGYYRRLNYEGRQIAADYLARLVGSKKYEE